MSHAEEVQFLSCEITQRLARHVHQTRFEDIPDEAIARAQLAVIDIIAVAIGGTTSKLVEQTRRIVSNWGGRADSRVLVFGDRLPAHNAAFVNAVMARVLDFDDTFELAPSGAHASAYIIPVAMALSDRDASISGKEFLSAIVIASDLYCRLTRSIRTNAIDTGRDNGASVFGTYACAARLLRLNLEQTLNGFGIAYAQSAGEFQMYEESSDTVWLQQGLRARSGIDSAEFAQNDVTGPHQVFFGRCGYFRAFEPAHDVDLLMDNLGQDFVSRQLSLKPFPCCKCMHPAITATIALRENSMVDPSEIQRIRIGTNRMCLNFLARPREQKWDPRNPAAAMFSLPYGVAVAAAKGAVDLADFDNENLDHPAVRRLIQLTEVEIDVDIESAYNQSPTAPARVHFLMLDGQELTHRVEHALGHPLNFPGEALIEKKFRDCAARSARPFTDTTLRSIQSEVKNLPDATQASGLLDLLVSQE